MSGYVLSPRAQADLDQIWNYTAERWDEDQADRYVLVIRAAIEAVVRDPRRGRACDHIRSGYRKYPAGSHMLFFRVISDGIDVVRILHQSMDFERHF
ncbi:MAG: type II toxin-antitoxin system RelE/ParE family toxin [Xanthobacteraceae bacterium]|nr:type II toxin-antitoxin system RelE/ParE family toxin [Xanthobacteraceae bacterium]